MTGRDRGSVTAEFALGLPVLVLVAVTGVASVAVMGARARCVDAARDAALAVARGESAAAAQHAVAASVPHGARVSIARDGDSVRVAVSARVSLVGSLLPAIAVQGDATAEVEPGDSDAIDG